jgi:hypothetical protein
MTKTVDKPCRCLVHHPLPGAERQAVVDRLKYSREVGDSQGTMIALMQLGQCKSRQEEPTQ